MLLQVLDANAVSQTVIIHGQETVVNFSGSITATGVPQFVLAANPGRSGWIMQNIGQNQIIVNDTGAAAVGAGSFIVSPLEFFPPPNYPTTTNAISFLGTTGDPFTIREW